MAEVDPRAHHQALPPGPPLRSPAAVAPSFAPRLASFALTKASLGAFLGGAILPDSMLSCCSSSGERGLLADSSLRLHPSGRGGRDYRAGPFAPLAAASQPPARPAEAEGGRASREPTALKPFPKSPRPTLGRLMSSPSQSCSPEKYTKRGTLVFSGAPPHVPCSHPGPFPLPECLQSPCIHLPLW